MNDSSEQCTPSVWTKATFGAFSLLNMLLGAFGGFLLIAHITASNSALLKKANTVNSYPKFQLRTSTILYWLSMTFVELFGLSAFTIFVTSTAVFEFDIYSRVGDVPCRILIFVIIACNDGSAWHAACVCLERFVLLLLPTSSYVINRSRIVDAVWIIVAIYTMSILFNIYNLTQEPGICASSISFEYGIMKLFYGVIIPCSFLMVAVIGSLVQLLRRKIRRTGSNTNIVELAASKDFAYDDAISTAKVTLVAGSLLLLSCAIQFATIFITIEEDTAYNVNMFCPWSGILLEVAANVRWITAYLKSYVFVLGGQSARRKILHVFLSMSRKNEK
ncbi:unnamed protein product [Calicophoron daubneyi]|uniref:G-protein coupled receptors family 1 profile domain-containing protein n=1 Tax=Calicophoron daubneyi TaxID=300641 RepID=A0AAV2TJH6_CALDB